ncbi:hypothetical protein [Pseudoalteromonas sp. SA25]|uniref:hypothetical protein n=1 Tax=Pseudoalteromonas sp. SA25 TaxID=2686347 RepID=UPI0013FD96ED|nr:hypothetical protein [Pseudoalteromonas sp. SA25]
MLTALKISDIGQLKNEIFAWLSTRFSHLRIDHLIKRIAIKKGRVGYQLVYKFKGATVRLHEFQTNIQANQMNDADIYIGIIIFTLLGF